MDEGVGAWILKKEPNVITTSDSPKPFMKNYMNEKNNIRVN